MKFARRLFVNDLKKKKCRKIFLKFGKPSKGVVDGEAIVGASAELGVPRDRHRHHKLGLSVHEVDSYNTMLSDEMTHFATILPDSLWVIGGDI